MLFWQKPVAQDELAPLAVLAYHHGPLKESARLRGKRPENIKEVVRDELKGSLS